MDRVERHAKRYGSKNAYSQWKENNGYDKIKEEEPKDVIKQIQENNEKITFKTDSKVKKSKSKK